MKSVRAGVIETDAPVSTMRGRSPRTPVRQRAGRTRPRSHPTLRLRSNRKDSVSMILLGSKEPSQRDISKGGGSGGGASSECRSSAGRRPSGSEVESAMARRVDSERTATSRATEQAPRSGYGTPQVTDGGSSTTAPSAYKPSNARGWRRPKRGSHQRGDEGRRCRASAEGEGNGHRASTADDGPVGGEPNHPNSATGPTLSSRERDAALSRVMNVDPDDGRTREARHIAEMASETNV
mmetsp:Transcript_13057/g.30917  ORF Transcript_13057/g.30917 Transcript_13057/m.30917 type:complete len:238 (-) Transcript_13057:1233-1946(-)